MSAARAAALVAAALVASACARGKDAPSAAPSAAPPPASSADAPDDAAHAPGGADGAAFVVAETFASPEAAFDAVLAARPLVLGVGEAHAQRGTEDVPPATRWFGERLLPRLEGRASDLLLELWAPDARCQREVKKVAEAQKPVVAEQAATNPNAYVALGTRARALGVKPHLLRPSCDDFAALADAGPPEEALGPMLALVRRLTARDVRAALARGADAGSDRVVVAYGGAMHNDLAPPEATAPYAFGPELDEATGGRYVELDLVVPEAVKDTPAWARLPWVATYRAKPPAPAATTLYRMGPRSFALVLPRHDAAPLGP